MSIVRDNLMNQPDYSPYCAGEHCRTMPRTRFNGEQFECPVCGWHSEFEADFIVAYKAKWVIDKPSERTTLASPTLRQSVGGSRQAPIVPPGASEPTERDSKLLAAARAKRERKSTKRRVAALASASRGRHA